MQLPTLTRGRLIRRYQRFFAEVCLDDGTIVEAHCANSGSMATCLYPGGVVWVSRNDNPKRKLRYTWELAETPEAMVLVYPLRANALVREGIENGTIRELAGFGEIFPEHRVGTRSRIDFLLQQGSARCYVEVKSVTHAVGAGRTSFPDAVSSRATRHLTELVALRKGGHRAVLVFSVGRSDAVCVEPAYDIDPNYAKSLREALDQGVEVLAYRAEIHCRDTCGTVRLAVPLDVHVK